MEMLQGVWKQHLRPRAVVGYGVKIFLPSPPNYVTRSPGWPYLPESSHHSKIREQVIGRSQICLLKRRYFFGAFPASPSVIPPARRSHYYNSTVVFCLRRVSFDILKLVKTKNLKVKET